MISTCSDPASPAGNAPGGRTSIYAGPPMVGRAERGSTRAVRGALIGGVAALVLLPLRLGRRVERAHLVLFMPDLQETLAASMGAAHGRQFVGAWSRLGLYHPGPLWFTWSAPFTALAGDQPSGLFVAALALAGAAAAATAILVARALGPTHGLLAVVVLLAALHQLSLAGLAAPWNPTVLILPVTLGLVAAAAATARGSLAAAAVGAVAGAFVAQAHLGALVLGAVVIVASVAGVIRARRRDAERATPWWAWAILAALVAAPWAPVLYDQLDGSGNALAVARYAATGTVEERFPAELPSPSASLSLLQVPTHVAATTALVEAEVAQWAGADFVRGRDHRPHPASSVVLLALVVVVAGGALAPRLRWRDRIPPFTVWLCRLSGAALLVQIAATVRARHEFRYYLIAGSSGVGVALWLSATLVASGLLVTAARPRRSLPALRAATVAVVVVAVVAIAPRPAMQDFPGFRVELDHDHPTVLALLDAVPSGGFSLAADRVGHLGPQGHILASLDHHGRRVQVTGRYASRFSDYNRRAGAGRQILLVAPGETAPPGFRSVGPYGTDVVWVEAGAP